MPVLDRKELEESPLSDLHAIASELGIEGYRRLRRDDLIDALAGDSKPSSRSRAKDDEKDEKPKPKPRSRSRSRSRKTENKPAASESRKKDEEPAADEPD